VIGKEPPPWGTVAAAVAVIACCALLPAIAVGAGVASAVAGAAVKYWPLTLGGVALAIWAGLRIVREVRPRSDPRGR
jgi:hypothetical protein